MRFFSFSIFLSFFEKKEKVKEKKKKKKTSKKKTPTLFFLNVFPFIVSPFGHSETSSSLTSEMRADGEQGR